MQYSRILVLAVLAVALAAGTARGTTKDFSFLFQPGTSGLNATMSVNAGTSGTLIGNYDATNNPTGTRTKPGLFGSFGSTENVAVPATLGLAVGGQPQSSATGSFYLSADVDNGAVWLDVLVANLISTPIVAGTTATVEYGTFRTRNPNSIFPGGVPVELPLGSVQITSMLLTQQGGPVAGTLMPLKSGQYQFSCLVPALLSVTAEYLGSPLPLPNTPVLLPFGGQLTLAGNTALVNSVQAIQFSNSTSPGTALPAIPVDVPTILPAGDTASLVLNLTLDDVSSSVDGTLTTVADGILIPEPATLGLLALGSVAVLSRRRNR